MCSGNAPTTAHTSGESIERHPPEYFSNSKENVCSQQLKTNRSRQMLCKPTILSCTLHSTDKLVNHSRMQKLMGLPELGGAHHLSSKVREYFAGVGDYTGTHVTLIVVSSDIWAVMPCGSCAMLAVCESHSNVAASGWVTGMVIRQASCWYPGCTAPATPVRWQVRC